MMTLGLGGRTLFVLLAALATGVAGCSGGGDSAADPVCGNGVREAGEDCDDGNPVNADGCEATCRFSCVAAENCDDGNVCTRDACETNARGLACSHAPAGAIVCDDGNGCTSGDTCDGTACAGVLSCECEADADCASREDGDLCNGTLDCDLATHTCVVDVATVVTCPTGGDTLCSRNRCTPGTGACAMQPEPVTTPCTDGSVCTGPDFCDGAGGCASGGPISCEDGIGCTTDACDPVDGCVTTPGHAACDDAVDCTTDACEPAAPDADPTTGCLSTPVDSACDDASGCTVDTCVAGSGCSNVLQPTWFEDLDGDGFGNPEVSACAPAAPAGFVGNAIDCCDASSETHPGQWGYFDTANGCGDFDYDCSGAAEPKDFGFASCSGTYTCASSSGFSGSAPPCGLPGSYLASCASESCGTLCRTCRSTWVTKTQACR